MTIGPGDFELSMDELRIVARYAVESAAALLPVFESHHRLDPRPRAAIDAARTFIDGAPRSRLQRTTALDAHRAAREASTEPARYAARATGDAASAAYLHPIARATQVGHILRPAALEARVAELAAPAVGLHAIQRSVERATPPLIAVLRRYPPAPSGRTSVAHLMSLLDRALRQKGATLLG